MTLAISALVMWTAPLEFPFCYEPVGFGRGASHDYRLYTRTVPWYPGAEHVAVPLRTPVDPARIGHEVFEQPSGIVLVDSLDPVIHDPSASSLGTIWTAAVRGYWTLQP